MGVSEARRLRQLDEENRKLKQLLAEATLDNHVLRELLRKMPETCCPTRSRAPTCRTQLLRRLLHPLRRPSAGGCGLPGLVLLQRIAQSLQASGEESCQVRTDILF